MSMRSRAVTPLLVVLGLVVLLLLVSVVEASRASAQTIDNGDGTCVQTDGQAGLFDGTSADDAGCITPAEYEAFTSVEGLADAGVLADVTDNGDGTVSALVVSTGVVIDLIADPWARPLAATPSLEPDSPTVGDYWAARGLVATRAVTGGGVLA